MDEPLAALDAARKADILPWLEQLHERLDLPVLYVTHALDEVARLADHLVLLDGGRVRVQGPVIEMLSRTDLPLAHGDGAGALIEAVTCGLQNDSGLCELRFDGGTLLLPQTRATPLPDRTPVRLHIQARDVSLALLPAQQSSVLNILPATVTDLSDDGPGQVLVGLRLGQQSRLLARISRLSCQRLAITPGLPVYAQIKGVAMVR
jgi:molybdate transport system ATP-binding protein